MRDGGRRAGFARRATRGRAAGRVAVGRHLSPGTGQPGTDQPGRLPWLAAGGRFDLTFVRVAGTRAGPSVALTDRTCATCGAAYPSEIATACGHCRTPRPLAWAQWRLARAVPVQ